MNNCSYLQELNGVDVSDYHVVDLSRDKFDSINLQNYPENRLHFLINAVQFGTKLPTEKSMQRS